MFFYIDLKSFCLDYCNIICNVMCLNKDVSGLPEFTK